MGKEIPPAAASSGTGQNQPLFIRPDDHNGDEAQAEETRQTSNDVNGARQSRPARSYHISAGSEAAIAGGGGFVNGHAAGVRGGQLDRGSEPGRRSGLRCRRSLSKLSSRRASFGGAGAVIPTYRPCTSRPVKNMRCCKCVLHTSVEAAAAASAAAACPLRIPGLTPRPLLMQAFRRGASTC